MDPKETPAVGIILTIFLLSLFTVPTIAVCVQTFNKYLYLFVIGVLK